MFGFGLVPLLFLSVCCFSGDELSLSVLMLVLPSNRPDVVGLDIDSLPTLSDGSFFRVSLPFTDECVPESDFDFDVDDVLAFDVLVTVALDVAFIVDCDDDAADDGTDDAALLKQE